MRSWFLDLCRLPCAPFFFPSFLKNPRNAWIQIKTQGTRMVIFSIWNIFLFIVFSFSPFLNLFSSPTNWKEKDFLEHGHTTSQRRSNVNVGKSQTFRSGNIISFFCTKIQRWGNFSKERREMYSCIWILFFQKETHGKWSNSSKSTRSGSLLCNNSCLYGDSGRARKHNIFFFEFVSASFMQRFHRFSNKEHGTWGIRLGWYKLWNTIDIKVKRTHEECSFL